MGKQRLLLLVFLLIIVASILLWLQRGGSQSQSRAPSAKVEPSTKVVINEAVRTLLYIPLYYAVDRGFFRESNLDVEIITGGTATNSFAAMISGEAQFSQADPMYVPISRAKGSKTKVVAQVVGRIALWILARDPRVGDWSAATIRRKRIATQLRPMTAYVYARKAIEDVGLNPDTDVELIENQPGTEIIPLLKGQADFAVTIEPLVSKAVSQGAHVLVSYPVKLGDRVFTGLMATEKFIRLHPQVTQAVVNVYQRSLLDLHRHPDLVFETAKRYFPQLDGVVLKIALARMLSEKVVPVSVEIPEESWDRAVAVRVAAGDLKVPASRAESCDIAIMQRALAH
jgi:NitT/TauT family transport system substrate-binding protein